MSVNNIVSIYIVGKQYCIIIYCRKQYCINIFVDHGITTPPVFRQVGVVGKFVEFYGPGMDKLSIADRATIANMCPEYGIKHLSDQ